MVQWAAALDNVLPFGKSVDLIVNDKSGAVWLLNFGCSHIKLWGGWGLWMEICLVFADLRPDVRLFDCCFPLALSWPHLQPLQPQPLSNRTDTDTSPSPSFQLTRPKTVFSAPVLPDMSLGHLEAGRGGGFCSVSPLHTLLLFSPQQEKAEGLHQAQSQGHTLGCPWPCLSLSLSTSPDC